MAAAIPFLMAGGAVISAAGAMSAAKAQAQAAEYNAQQSTTNATMALDQAREQVIAAHRVLMSLNDKNKNTFKELVDSLESDRSHS